MPPFCSRLVQRRGKYWCKFYDFPGNLKTQFVRTSDWELTCIQMEVNCLRRCFIESTLCTDHGLKIHPPRAPSHQEQTHTHTHARRNTYWFLFYAIFVNISWHPGKLNDRCRATEMKWISSKDLCVLTLKLHKIYGLRFDVHVVRCSWVMHLNTWMI